LAFLTKTCDGAKGTLLADKPCPTDIAGSALLGCCVSPAGHMAQCMYANHAATADQLKKSCGSTGSCWATATE
jgi:hypothetical protein